MGLPTSACPKEATGRCRDLKTLGDENPIKTYKNHWLFGFFCGFLVVFGQKTMVINHG